MRAQRPGARQPRLARGHRECGRDLTARQPVERRRRGCERGSGACALDARAQLAFYAARHRVRFGGARGHWLCRVAGAREPAATYPLQGCGQLCGNRTGRRGATAGGAAAWRWVNLGDRSGARGGGPRVPRRHRGWHPRHLRIQLHPAARLNAHDWHGGGAGVLGGGAGRARTDLQQELDPDHE